MYKRTGTHTDSTEFIDPQDVAELTRLSNKSHLVTRHMGLFPAKCDLANVHTVLDVACGPGAWVLQVAKLYPQMRVYGIDISQRMLDYARELSLDAGLTNVVFRRMNVVEQPLHFAPESFDLINARFLCEFMPGPYWGTLIREFRRILKHGGTLIMTEFEMGMASTPVHQQLVASFCEVMTQVGRCLAPEPHPMRLGIIEHLNPWLTEAGFLVQDPLIHAIDYSFGSDAHETWCKDLLLLVRHVTHFLLKAVSSVSADEWERTLDALSDEMEQEHFHGLFHFLTAWGRKGIVIK